MEQDTTTTVQTGETAAAATADTTEATAHVETELLVEEISIDGMCGVY